MFATSVRSVYGNTLIVPDAAAVAWGESPCSSHSLETHRPGERSRGVRFVACNCTRLVASALDLCTSPRRLCTVKTQPQGLATNDGIVIFIKLHRTRKKLNYRAFCAAYRFPTYHEICWL
ncbi:hypothetical protein VTN00DRAFT_6488 [Thermoascus crustaceus]|uniref:uncharacterized protein n=1 Tax=Thermoascus crustaceus TaxID=5088 RepID=UPI0037420393